MQSIERQGVDLSAWIMFSVASLSILGIPGPITLLAMARASNRGLVGAAPLALGAVLGDGVALLLSFAGIGAILQSSQFPLVVVRILGACYLLWVGAKMLFESRQTTSAAGRSINDGSFREGFFLAAMHPASLVFFVAYVPFFIMPDAPVLPQFAVMAATFIVLGLMSVFAWAAFASIGIRALAQQDMTNRLRQLAGGVVLIFGGTALANAVGTSLHLRPTNGHEERVTAIFGFRAIGS